MSQTVTAVQAPAPLGRLDGHTNFVTLEYLVENGVTVNYGDFVKYGGTVGVTNSSMTGDARPLGMALGTVTGDGSTKTVLVCIDPMMTYLIKSSTTAFTAANRGSYFDLANANQISNSASTTTGAFILLYLASDTVPNVINGAGLQGVNTASYGVFKLVESALNPLGS